jgi:hypothetical protein
VACRYGLLKRGASRALIVSRKSNVNGMNMPCLLPVQVGAQEDARLTFTFTRLEMVRLQRRAVGMDRLPATCFAPRSRNCAAYRVRCSCARVQNTRGTERIFIKFGVQLYSYLWTHSNPTVNRTAVKHCLKTHAHLGRNSLNIYRSEKCLVESCRNCKRSLRNASLTISRQLKAVSVL